MTHPPLPPDEYISEVRRLSSLVRYCRTCIRLARADEDTDVLRAELDAFQAELDALTAAAA